MKTFYFLIFLLFVSLGWGIYLKVTYAPTTAETQQTSNNTNTTNTTTNTQNTTPAKIKPTPTPASKCNNGGSCTATEVAQHDTRSNCWVYLSPINKVYDVTEYVSDTKKHPGGNIIVPHCGTNIYNVFIKNDGGHAHSTKALETILQSYYIAPFQS